jgi:hypothetical protein
MLRTDSPTPNKKGQHGRKTMIRNPFYDYAEHEWRGATPYYPPYPPTPPPSPLEELKRIDEYSDYLEARKKRIKEEGSHNKPHHKGNEKPFSAVDWMLLQAFVQPFLILGYLYFLVKILK